MNAPQRYEIRVGEEAVGDLRDRLGRTRWPEQRAQDYVLAQAGQQKSRLLFAPERQLGPRLAVIEREALACGARL